MKNIFKDIVFRSENALHFAGDDDIFTFMMVNMVIYIDRIIHYNVCV